MGQRLRLLLQEAQLLKVVRRQAHEVALPRDRDLERLADPPRRVGRQTGAVADVEAVDRLHQAADRLLEQVGVAQGVVAEALGDVGGEADVGGREAMFQVNVAVVQAADGGDAAGLAAAVLADELGHRPRLQRRAVLAQPAKVADRVRTNSFLQSQNWSAVPVFFR